MTIPTHIFRAYDIRGLAETELNEDGCRQIGVAFGETVKEKYGIDSPRIAVGRDARTHGPAFHKAVCEGLLATGCTVLDIGQTPSPVNYFTICDQELDGGIQVTASHNGPEYNGLKLQVRNAEAHSGDDLQVLRERIEHSSTDFPIPDSPSPTPYDAITPYISRVLSMFEGKGEGLHIVIDHGNGVAGPVYNDILKKIGCTLTELYSEPDGTFPNHPADPSKHSTLKELQETVIREGADLGMAFDGDGDRLGIVDEKGVIRSSDDILLLLSEDHLTRFPGGPIVFTVSNSGVLNTEITAWGGKPVMCAVGHSVVEHAMHEHGSKLGGEQSGHFFCGEDYFDFDDACVAALRFVEILKAKDLPCSEVLNSYPKVFQSPERRPHCPDDKKQSVIASITEHFQTLYPCNTLDGVRIDFGEGAWAGIRQSNTSPCISICIEARSEEGLTTIENEVLEHIGSYPEIEL